jgi:glycosyltransferase involved in cell wall biosynthesis
MEDPVTNQSNVSISPRMCIFIPTYNSAEFIADLLISIQRDPVGLQNIGAVYIFDDGSRDETPSVARDNWTANTQLVVMERSSNVGECQNVNMAMNTLRQDDFEWALLLHHDDVLLPGWLDRASTIVRDAAPEIAVVCCGHENGTFSGVARDYEDTSGSDARGIQVLVHPGGEESVRQLRRRWYWGASGSVFQVSAFHCFGGFHPGLRFAGDNDLLVRLHLAGYGVLECTQNFIYKRHHADNQTSQSFRSGADAMCWSYLMHKYLPYSSRRDRAEEHLRMMYTIVRRSSEMTRSRNFALIGTQLRSLRVLAQSMAALVPGLYLLLPGEVKRLLEYRFDRLHVSGPD